MSNLIRRTAILAILLAPALANISAHGQQPSQAPAKEANEDALQLRVFNLKYSQADAAAKVIQRLMSSDQVRVATDDRTNAVIVEGSATQLKIVENLLKEIDRSEPDFQRPDNTQPPVENLTLRLVWLLEGAPETGLQAPLSDAFEELQRLGVPGLGIAGQLLIKTTSDSEFSLSSELEVEPIGGTCLLAVEGYVESPQLLRLSIDVRRTGETKDSSGKSLTRINTSLAIEPGKVIVLGANPTGKHTSAFIVLLEKR